MTTPGVAAPQLPRAFPSDVAERVLAELPGRGEKVLAAMRTADALIAQIVGDDRGLRLAESAAYNVREALDAVVSGVPASGDGQRAVFNALAQYESEVAQPGIDDASSLQALLDVLRRLEQDRDRISYRTRQLLTYLRDKSGVDPLPGDHDPVKEYGALRNDASQRLHSQARPDDAVALYDRAVAWFIRMFTPPDALAQAVRALAAEPWRDTSQLAKLRDLASNQHHLRLFMTQLADPAWLTPLRESGFVRPPGPDGVWPVAGLVDGLGRTHPEDVATLLERLLKDCTSLPSEQQLTARFELLRLATQLGSAGHRVVARVVAEHPDVEAVRALGTGVVRHADPADRVVQDVARAVLRGEPGDHDRYYYELVLRHLEAGLTTDNVAGRVRMVAVKAGEVVEHPQANWVRLDDARLTSELNDDDHSYLVVLSHYLARLITKARSLDVSSTKLRHWTRDITGEIGERITSHILAGADDVSISEKIEHVTRRLASRTCSGDDKDLVNHVLAQAPDPSSLEVWADALGTPSATPPNLDEDLPKDWARAWCWSLILPDHILVDWRDQIAQVTARYGAPQPDELERRFGTTQFVWGSSPHSAEELSLLPVPDAAQLVSRWRPDAESRQRLQSARELARALQTVVEADPVSWSQDPQTVVTTLREPVYILHYFNALTTKAQEVTAHSDEIIAAATLARTEQRTPAVLGDDDFDFEPGWRRVNTATVDLIAALANHDGLHDAHLDTAWEWALALTDRTPNDYDRSFDGHDALARAINNDRGRSLLTLLALAGWEHRHHNAVRDTFTDVLDEVVRIRSDIGMEYRAILAHRRALLEAVANDWLDANIAVLFRDEELGAETFSLTLKYEGRATPWFYSNLRDDLYAAAQNNTEHAITWLLIGALHHEPGYELETVISSLRRNPDALSIAAGEVATVVQNSEPDSTQLQTAVGFWTTLLNSDRDKVPASTLPPAGRWAFVDGLDDTTWAQLTAQTLDITDGSLACAIEVADRCRTAPIPTYNTLILLRLLGHGEPWEQHYVARAALDALQAISTTRPDEHFHTLRTRLIELGYYDATDIEPFAVDSPSSTE